MEGTKFDRVGGWGGGGGAQQTSCVTKQFFNQIYQCPWYIIVHRGAQTRVVICTVTKTLT